MFNLKNFKYSLSFTVALSTLLAVQTLPTKAQNNSPSAGQAGVRSGTVAPYNTTVFSVPPILSEPLNTPTSYIRTLVEVTTVNATTEETTRDSREINSVQELAKFLGDTVAKVLGNGSATVLMRGLTITIEDNTENVLTKRITFAKEGRAEETLEVTGTSQQIIEIISVTGILYDFDVPIELIRQASQLILAGADYAETSNLIFALNGMTVEGQDVDINKLSNAINAYNAIIDQADAETIASLQNTQAFMDIGQLLRELRTSIG